LRGEKNMPFNLFRKKKQSEDKPLSTFPQDEPQQTAPAISTQPPETTETLDNQTAVSAENPLVENPAVDQAGTQQAASDAQEPEPELEPAAPIQEPPQEQPTDEAPIVEPPIEQKPDTPAESPSKTYLKAMPLKDLSDTEKVKTEVSNGNIIILRVTPLAGKSIEDVKKAVNELFQFAESTGGDIARLGEERVVICPKNIRIWREKTPAPVTSSSEPLPTAA
jgi:SepF-like predicted cell division protein (DUF552 family)